MKQSFKNITVWIKKHPWLAAIIIGGVILLAVWTINKNRGVSDMVDVSQIPENAPADAGAAGGLTETPSTPEPSAYDVPIPIFSGGGSGGGGGGKGGGGNYASSYPASTEAPLLDTSMFDTGAGFLDRSAAELYYSSLTPEEQANYQQSLPYLFSGAEPAPMSTSGGRSSGLKTITSPVSGSPSGGQLQAGSPVRSSGLKGASVAGSRGTVKPIGGGKAQSAQGAKIVRPVSAGGASASIVDRMV